MDCNVLVKVSYIVYLRFQREKLINLLLDSLNIRSKIWRRSVGYMSCISVLYVASLEALRD